MLEYVADDLLDSPAQTLVNPVNTVGVMGKGLALEFKKRFPEMFARYRAHCESGELTVGKLWLYKSPAKWILNFPTKAHWRDPSKPKYIEAGLRKFVATYAAHGIASVSFPQLGCANGGLSWERTVRPMMEHYLGRLEITVRVHVRD